MKILSTIFKPALFVFFLVICSEVFSQEDKFVITGERLTLRSDVLGEDRRLWIHDPSNGSENAKLPVIYLLDGDFHFSSVSALADYMASNGLSPSMIVVGIENTNRTRDLTPTEADPDHPYSKDGRFETSGGGAEFMKFLETELFPFIEDSYPTAPYRMFIGHSFGGLTAMDALHHYSHLFNSFVSIDPSLWWSNQSLLNQIRDENRKDLYKGKSMYLGIANTISPGTTFQSAIADTSLRSEHMRAIIEIDEFLKSHPENGLKFGSKYYSDDDHGTVPLITEYDAFRFIFDFYRFDRSEFDDSSLDKYLAHIRLVSKNLGYHVTPDEYMINGMAYQYMEQENYELARKALELNINNYPSSGNVYDSMGDYYVAVGNKDEAIKSFQQALEIEDAPHSREKMESLKAEK
ncbi:MAG: alpha/beta hydrolase-fold protein [Flavobacteriales bacterium]|nr:alpha/beta hydrolase-fold protein [Flavobacteriales bacterium]